MPESKVKKTVYLGTGRRKSSVARVRITEGSGELSINARTLEDFFTEDKDRAAVTGPLDLLEVSRKVDVKVTVLGGGISGQSGAISQGVARALKKMYGLTTAPAPTEEGQEAINSMDKKLRDSGYLTRDGRMKERKKYGLKGARKAFQFSKR